MSQGKNQHVVPHPEGWAVVAEGTKRPTVVKPTQAAAVKAANMIATNQHSELFVHGRNGQIRERSSHGHDPRRSRG